MLSVYQQSVYKLKYILVSIVVNEEQYKMCTSEKLRFRLSFIIGIVSLVIALSTSLALLSIVTFQEILGKFLDKSNSCPDGWMDGETVDIGTS